MNKNNFLILLAILILALMYIVNISYCAGGKQDMDKINNIIDLVDRFKLQGTNKIIIETNKRFGEDPYFKKTIVAEKDITDFLNSLKKNTKLNTFVKTFARYDVTFYQDNKEIFKLGINDWGGSGFIRPYSKEIESDLLPNEDLIKTLHELLKKDS